MWNNPMFSLFVIVLCYALADIITTKTHGKIVSILVVCVVYILGYCTGIIPATSPADTGMVTLIATFGSMLFVANVGTMLDLKQFIREWRTVVVCLCSMGLMVVAFMTVGSMVFGREMALCAIPPISGGTVAAMLVSEEATSAGRGDLASLTVLLVTLQTFIGVPVSSFCLQKYCKHFHANMKLSKTAPTEKEDSFHIRFLPQLPEEYNGPHMILAKLILVCIVGSAVSKATNGMLPAVVVILVLSILCHEIGFLETNALQTAGMYNFLFLGMCVFLPSMFSSMTFELLGSMIAPLLFFLVLGAASLMVGSGIAGRLFKLDFRLAAALGPTALFGFPGTLIVTSEVIKAMNLPEEESKRLTDEVLPKMIVAGFTTVSAASVILAGFIVPHIFA